VDCDIMGLEDDAAALRLAHLLDARPWHRLPPTALLRLLNTLCYDIAQVGVGLSVPARLASKCLWLTSLPLYAWGDWQECWQGQVAGALSVYLLSSAQRLHTG
jgi:hypothetical protein